MTFKTWLQEQRAILVEHGLIKPQPTRGITMKTNPEAVILGALFDFAGHLRTSDIINPLSGIDGFAKSRKLSATEVPTLTWRDQLDTLRDNAEHLPSDSELVTDLLLLAAAFKDGDPDADNKVFDVLNNAAARLRRIGAAPATADDALDGGRYRFVTALGTNETLACAVEKVAENVQVLGDAPTAELFGAHIDQLMGVAIAAGLWPLKDGAQ